MFAFGPKTFYILKALFKTRNASVFEKNPYFQQ